MGEIGRLREIAAAALQKAENWHLRLLQEKDGRMRYVYEHYIRTFLQEAEDALNRVSAMLKKALTDAHQALSI